MAGSGGKGVRIDQLESFLLAAERGSLTQAARELSITQPGLSRQIQRLERELGIVLFARIQDGIRLTPAGERLRTYAHEALALHQQLLGELCGVQPPLHGELRIIASTTPGEFLVPGLVAEFAKEHPGVTATVYTADSQVVANEVMERRWDFGFAGACIECKGLRYDPVAEDEIVLAVPSHHPFARLKEVQIDALQNERFLEREGGSGTILSVRRLLAEQGQELPPHRVVMVLSTTQAIVSAVRQSYGIGFVSSLALQGQQDQVIAVRLAGLPLHRTLYMVRDGRRVLAPPSQQFSEFVLRSAPQSGNVSARCGTARHSRSTL